MTISRSPWNDNNSIGNTFSNLFEGWEKNEIANLYCRSEMPANQICQKYFSISDAQLLCSLINPYVTAGCGFILKDNVQNKKHEQGILSDVSKEQKREKLVYNFFKIYRSSFFLMIHELIWLFGRWRSTKFDAFLDELSPDLIFMPVFQSRYAHRLLWYIQKRTKAKIVLFHADDYVTMRQFSFSPFFWLNRMLGRRAIMKSVKLSSINYCISQKQVNEYNNILKKPCKVLYKCGDFTDDAPVKENILKPIKLVYTGNIGGGRWRTLAMIGKALSVINKNGIIAQLDIYTLTPCSNTMKIMLNNGSDIFLKGSLTASQVKVKQQAADILVHVESFNKKYLLEARLSFSTKIVDYLQQARCIFAVGSIECASIDYIEKNDAGVVAVDENKVYEKLRMLVDTPSLIRDYGHKAYICGSKNHQKEKIKTMLKTDLSSLIAQKTEAVI